MKLTESTIQNLLYSWREGQGHKLIVPNIGLHYGYADLVSVTKNDFTYEHEIKISCADFKADFKKHNKHYWMQDAFDKKKPQFSYYAPNYFVYVCPENVIDPSSIPVYAGLIYITSPLNNIEIIVKPPRIHSEQISLKRKEFLSRGLMLRYWKQRKKEHKATALQEV